MNAGSTWGNSTGFGQASLGSGGGLFGNSTTNPGAAASPFGSNTASTSFGAQPSTTPANNLFGGALTGPTLTFGSNLAAKPNTGLFGASNTSNTAGGLFGNSTLNAPASASGTSATSTGPFGSTAPNTASGGLFGNSSANSGGLFGNTNANNANTNNTSTNNSGGLFGSSAPPASGLNASTSNNSMFGASKTGGLFGNSSTQPTTGGLFNSGTLNTGLLSANKPATGGLFGSSTTQGTNGGLFGSSNTQNASGGLFGSSAKPAGGLFGSSNTGLMGNQNSGLNAASVSASNTNPYQSDSILNSINNTEASMPLSITGSLFVSKPASKKRSFAATDSKPENKRSLLGRLAQTFNIFRVATDASSSSGMAKIKGVFTLLNYVKDPTSANTEGYSIKKPKNGLRIPAADKSVGAVTKLVIKSKPLRFHLINADKVLNAKRRRILTLTLNSGKYIAGSITDDELSDDDEPAPQLTPAPVVMKGESTKSEDLNEEASPEEPTNEEGYFCSPSLKDLSQLTLPQLSEVVNFIVGRVDHGQIAYQFPVNLSQLFERCDMDINLVAKELFGKIIKIDNAVIRVYDDEDLESPGMGFELNVPATITVKAPPKKNHTVEQHIKRLQNFTGMTFVTYDPITYNWTFNVKHFSVWGLIEDSEDENDETEQMKRLRFLKKEQDSQEDQASATYSRIYENETYKQELKRQKIERITSGLPGGWEHDTTVKSGGLLNVKQQLVQNEINQAINLYKHDKSVAVLAANASDITIDSEEESGGDSENSIALNGPLYPDEVKNYDYLKQIVSVLPPNTDMDELVDEKAYEPDVEDDAIFDVISRPPALPTSKDWLLQLELANDINSALTPLLAVPRKAKKSLNAMNDLLFSDFNKSSVDLNQASTPIKETKEPQLLLSESASVEKSLIVRGMQNLLLKSSISTRSNKYPEVEIDSSLNFKTVASIFSDNPDFNILSLGVILFDKVDLRALAKYQDVDFSNTQLVKRLELLEQKKAFAAWLKSYIKNQKLDIAPDYLDAIFKLVCEGNLKGAIEQAIATRNLHLASIITLLDSNDEAARSISLSQLESWESSSSIDYIPAPIVNIHKILKGDFDEVSEGLPYSVALGLRIFYGNPIESLESVFEHILPTSTRDNLSDVLRIYVAYKSKSFAETGDVIYSSQLSSHVKWLIFQTLAASATADASLARDSIGEQFGKELQRLGLWKEAVFVFSSVDNNDSAEELIRQTIIKNVQFIKAPGIDEEEYLVNVLKVPQSLVYEAIAIDKFKRQDFWGKGEALAVAELWEEAHENICKVLGPTCVIEDDAEHIARLQTLIASFPDKGGILPNWNHGAGLYARYFDVLAAYDSQGSIESEDLDFLLNNMPLAPRDSFSSGVAAKIMAKKIGDIALENRRGVLDLRDKITALTLGENEKNYFARRLLAAGL